ncbi:hypothetical protein CBL_06313 [Carabus blaptoides fortunei]
MKLIIVLAALIAVAVARPQHGKDAVILRYENNNIGVDGFNWANSAIPKQQTFNMKVIIVLAAVVAAAVAMPQGDAVITRLENDNIGLGNYNYA